MKKYLIPEWTSITVYQDFGPIRKCSPGLVKEELTRTEDDLVHIPDQRPCDDPDCEKEHNWLVFNYEGNMFGVNEDECYIIESVQNTLKNTPSETLVNKGSDFSDFTVH